ncbi:MAG: dihydrofolate reductase [Rubrivivax sp.]
MRENATRPTLALIAAVARNGVIGHDNRLLWKLPEDMAHFRATTTGHPVIMGRKTWDSLPAKFRPLPGRRNIVVTRNAAWQAEGAEAVHTPQAALQRVPTGRVFVIGGADLYAAALPLADELWLTELDADFDGDTQFPAWDRSAFVEVERRTQRAAPPNHFDLHFVRYVRC